MPSKTYLGFDLSTQQCKVVAINADLELLKVYAVGFDEDLPKYKTVNGVLKHEGGRIVAPVAMWLEALDLVFDRMKYDGFAFENVAGISGSCQQHGSVYWAEGAAASLAQLDQFGTLKDALAQAFSHDMSPNWQDHSTIEECKEFTESVGGKEKLAELTGSKAYHRFTGPQIKKFISDHPNEYDKTERITLVSNFLSTVLLGLYSKIDMADSCGMNLYDITKKKWNEKLLGIAAGNKGIYGLLDKLGNEVEPVGHHSIGPISPFFVKKYGFNQNCQIYAFTGDNLATILSLPLLKNDLLVSLGTLTTLLMITDTYKPNPNYHVMIHPTNSKLYMNMICYSNGALPRNSIRNSINKQYSIKDESWDKFSEILLGEDYEASGSQKIGVYFPQGEIIPNVDHPITAKFQFDQTTGALISRLDGYASPEFDVKGIVESQALSCRIRVKELLKEKGESEDELTPHQIFFVGGTSRNQAVIDKFSEILGSEKQKLDHGKGNFKSLEPNGCALGGAYKANWSDQVSSDRPLIGFNEYLAENFEWANLKEFRVKNCWDNYKVAEFALRNLEATL